jgi:Spy/CpxP family protein refolding chaperone
MSTSNMIKATMCCKYLSIFTMKHLLTRLSASLLLTLAATANLPANSQPTTSPTASATSGKSEQLMSSPLLRGVTLTAQQQNQLLSIRKETDNQISQMLTPAQKKLVATKGPKAVQLTKPQQEKYVAIAKNSSAKVQAVFTPAQIQQIKANIQSIQGANGQTPAPGGKK